MQFIDFFSGVGGFRRGMELAGHECAGFCEYDKFAIASYTAMHLCTQTQLDYLATLPKKKRVKEILKNEYRNGEWFADDIRGVCGRDVPESDCWCFGFPCVDISLAGNKLGFRGEKSSLFFEVIRLLAEREEDGLSRPRYLFIENVKNLLSINRGFDFEKVLTALDERGYDAEWSVLNSKNFGVPHNRERCFIIGHLRGKCTTEVFPVEGADGKGSVRVIGHRSGYRRNTQIFDPDGITEVLSTCQGGGREHHTIKVIGKLDANRHSQMDINGIDEISPTLDRMHEPKKVDIPVLDSGDEDDEEDAFEVRVKQATKTGYAVARSGRDSVNFSVLDSKTRRGRVGVDIANTLDTSCNQGIFVKVSPELTVYAVWYPKEECYIAIRKLTPRECFRLQSWKDDYFEKAEIVNTDTQLYKQAGNGVTVNVVEAIANKMK